MSPFSNPGHAANQRVEKGTFNFSPPRKSFKRTMIFFSHNDGQHAMRQGKVESPLFAVYDFIHDPQTAHDPSGDFVVLAGVGIMWLWQYAYSPEGRALVIIAQLKNEKTSVRGWMLQHHMVRPGFPEPAPGRYVCLIFNWDRVMAASDQIVKLGEKALPIMIGALRDENWDVRLMGVITCGRFRDPIAIQPLVTCLRASRREPGLSISELVPTGAVQRSCLHSLVEIGPKAFDSLIQLLEDPQEAVRYAAIEALGRLKDKRATEPLIRQLNGGDAYASLVAARALGEIGDPTAIPALLKAFGNKDVDILIHIPVAAALARMERDEGFTFLVGMLKSSDPGNRADAAEQLANTPVQGTFGPLLSLLDDRDSYVCAGGIEAYGESKVVIRGLAARALGKLQDIRAVPALRKLLNDPDPDVRECAADALEKLGVKDTTASQPGKP